MPLSSSPLDHLKGDRGDGWYSWKSIPCRLQKAFKPEVWRMMIVDDDQDVHSSTTFALGNLQMEHRQLEFVHAYSASRAREMLQYESEIAVILLGTVIEQPDAGPHLVRHIRKTLKLTDVRIILRCGQPSYAPVIDAVRYFDINDYQTNPN